MRLLLNEWQLVTTFKPGTGDVRFTDPESWRKYIFDQGPSPVQSLVVGAGTVDNVFQVLEDPTGITRERSQVEKCGRVRPARDVSVHRGRHGGHQGR